MADHVISTSLVQYWTRPALLPVIPIDSFHILPLVWNSTQMIIEWDCNSLDEIMCHLDNKKLIKMINNTMAQLWLLINRHWVCLHITGESRLMTFNSNVIFVNTFIIIHYHDSKSWENCTSQTHYIVTFRKQLALTPYCEFTTYIRLQLRYFVSCLIKFNNKW